LIQDSYARGNVQAVTTGTYAWVGGLIGGNANDSIVARTYATGDVHSTVGTLPPLYAPLQTNAGPAAGGIAGYNYYTIDTEVRNSVALNSLVYGNQTTQDVVHRVVGDVGTAPQGTLHRNLAYAGMSVGANWTLDEGADLPDGDNTVAQPGQSVYEALNWTFGTIWHMGADGYPAL
jgi:hypothetical protein